MDIKVLLEKTITGFKTLQVGEKYKIAAIGALEEWLIKPQYQEYKEQIVDMINSGKWDLILDSFYQTIPFGTGGRRGLVGIGPNRINTDTIESSAQGHSQYLMKKFGEEAKSRGVVIAFDVRQFLNEKTYNNKIPNPVFGLSCKDLAIQAACVYAANGIKVYLFKDFTSTPELSFTVRELKAVAGDMISASHNQPDWNGKKVVDETGGQLVPPLDENLVNIVVNQVTEIKSMDFEEAKEKKLIEYATPELHRKYHDACKSVSQDSQYRNLKILFSPFHGTSYTSVLPVLTELGFDIIMDEASGKPDPKFSSILFNIPNPEVIEAYRHLIKPADEMNADIIITADPDGDRFGLMSKEKSGWHFINGNDFFVLAVSYLLEEKQKAGLLKPNNVIIKTAVTTNLTKVIAEGYNVEIVSDLLVGIKYIAEEMNKLEKQGRIDDFLIGGEESHGMTSGDYIRDKDSCVPAILISELASREKANGRTLLNYLYDLYRKYGYYRNYLTEIRLPGAEGMSNMERIQEFIRKQQPTSVGDFKIISIKDYWQGEPFLSETDKVSRNVIVFHLATDDNTRSISVTIRPSGTEPKTKIYFEIGRFQIKEGQDLEAEIENVEKLLGEIEKAVLKYLYKIIGIDFPDRGFLLFWQLDANVKMKYFDIESDIANLLEEKDVTKRQEKLDDLLEFLGADPIDKIDRAFKAKYKQGIIEYLKLNL